MYSRSSQRIDVKNSQRTDQALLPRLDQDHSCLRNGDISDLLDRCRCSVVIQPWEKSLIRPIEKAIQTSELGINPSNDGSVIRLVFPELTEERRKELAKDVKKKGDGAKVAIRNIRRDANEAFKKMEKNDEISEDDLKELTEKVQKLTDKSIEKIDKAVENKTKEILTV